METKLLDKLRSRKELIERMYSDILEKISTLKIKENPYAMEEIEEEKEKLEESLELLNKIIDNM
jgi:fatty acid-binding protein DegV